MEFKENEMLIEYKDPKIDCNKNNPVPHAQVKFSAQHKATVSKCTTPTPPRQILPQRFNG